MAVVAHTFTHSQRGVSHSAPQANKGSEQHFYRFSTIFPRGYYYYLYIYKSRFQADHLQITVSSLSKTNLMSARATA